MSKHNFLMFFFYYTIYEEFAYIKKTLGLSMHYIKEENKS